MIGRSRRYRAERDVLLWLHAELEHKNAVQKTRLDEARTLAAARKVDAQIARDTLARVEKSEEKWRTIAQTVVDQPDAATRAILIDGHGAWSRGALAVALDEFDRCRDITRRVVAARDGVKRFIRDSHQLGVCHPIAESLARSLSEILDDATSEGGHQ